MELVLGTNRKADWNGGCAQLGVNFLNASQEVGAHAIHLVNVSNLWNMIFVSLTPNCLRLRLHAPYCAESRNGPVEDAERTLHLNSEVYVTRSVYQVDLIGFPVIVPEGRGRSRSDGDATLLFLNHPVHRGCAIVNLSDLMRLSSVKKDALGRGCLTSIDVSHDADIPSKSKISFCCCHLNINAKLETEMSKCLVGFGHLMHVLFPLEGTALIVIGRHDLGSEFFCH